MKHALRALAAVLALMAGFTPVMAQQFPTVPGHSLIGRIGVVGQSGPSQAIPFGTIQGLLLNQVTPEAFGGGCTVADNGPAIQAAINSATPVAVTLGPCTYRVVTPIVWNKRKVSVVGQGRYISAIDFEPGADATLFTIGAGLTSVTHAYEEDFRGFSVISADTTHSKAVWNFIDVSQAHLSDVSCTQTILAGGLFTGGTGSICLLTNGRDLSTFENLEFYADKPIVIADNPNVYLSTDHYVFRDIYLVGNSTGPCISTTAVLTNLNFEGRQAWAACKGGFKAAPSPTYPGNTWNDLTLNNVRHEQSPLGSTPDIDINATGANLRGLWINNTQINAGGIKLRSVLGGIIGTGQASCSPNANILDINTTDDQITWLGKRVEAACTMTPSSGVAMVMGESDVNPTGSAVPAYARFYAATPNINFNASISSTGAYQAGSPTGGLKGAGTINLSGDYYKNGTVIPETVTGPITLSAGGVLGCATCVLIGATAHGNSDYTILSTDRYVYTNAAFTAPRVWTLPAANSLVAGSTIWIEDAQNTVTSANTLTVSRAGADTINIGSTTLLITGAGGGITFTSDGVSNWGVPVQTVSSGGTGRQTLTSNAVVVGNGTSGVQSVGPGTTGQALLGVTSSAPAFGTVIVNVKRQSFCASGCVTTVAAGGTSTYTPSTGLVSAWVRCVGTGGGGGAVTGSAGAVVTASGGGAGAYSDVLLTAAQIGASKTVTNGTAGTGATAGNNAGTTGGDTSLGTLCVAKGGAGGTFANTGVTVAPAAGGAGASGTGDVLASGAPSSGGYVSSVLTSTVYGAGLGGSSIFGGGGLPGSVSGGSAVAGNAATQYGSGGGGASASNVAATAGGGAGSTGGVWIVEYVNQ